MNPADSKLLAHSQARQHVAIRRAEQLAKQIDRDYRATWQAIVGILSAGGQVDLFRLRTLLLTLVQGSAKTIDRGLAVIAEESYQQTVHGWADSVPRVQWRAVLGLPIPESRLGNRSADDPDPSRRQFTAGRKAERLREKTKDAFDYLVGPLQFEPQFEPAIGKLTDAELEELLKRVLFDPPSDAEVQQIIRTSSNSGRAAWPERLQQQGISFDRIANTISTRMASGGNVEEVAREVLPLVNGNKARAEAIARTEGLRVSNAVQQRISLQADDLIIGYQRLATLDQYTEPSHAAKNGLTFYKPGLGPAGAPTLDDPRYVELPERKNCRCTYVPVIAEPAEFAENPEFAAEFENAAGKTIPDPASYDAWFRQADQQTQRQAVGAGRLATMRRVLAKESDAASGLPPRQPDWLDFIDVDGEPVSRERLKNETPAQRSARRAAVSEVLRRRETLFRQVSQFGFSRG